MVADKSHEDGNSFPTISISFARQHNKLPLATFDEVVSYLFLEISKSPIEVFDLPDIIDVQKKILSSCFRGRGNNIALSPERFQKFNVSGICNFEAQTLPSDLGILFYSDNESDVDRLFFTKDEITYLNPNYLAYYEVIKFVNWE